MSYFDPQNPGLQNLDDFTSAELAVLLQIATLPNPDADRILFWDNSASSYEWLELGTNLSITGTVLNAAGGGGGGISDGDKGDISVTGSGSVWTIDNDVVTNTKLADMAGHSVKVRVGGSSGDPSDLVLGSHDVLGRNGGDIQSIPAGTNTVLLRKTGNTLGFDKVTESELSTSVNDSLDLADSAVQDLADLGITASAIELNYTDGVTSAIQTQLDGKLGTSLTSARIFVGNGSNVATGVAMSGDATLANTGAITAQPALITGKSSATVASGDLVLIADINDSNNLKQVTAQSIAELNIQQMFVLYGATTLVVPASSTRFLGLEGRETIAASEAGAEIVMKKAGTVKGFYLTTNTAQPASGSFVITVRKNGANTSLTFTIAAGSAAGTYGTDVDVSYVDGDKFSVSAVNNASASSAQLLTTTAKII